MEDVLKTYERPLSESEPVVCVDEKPVVLHEDTRPPIPMQPGQIGRRDYEYLRCGTYLSAGEDNYIEFRSEEIAEIEKLPDPPPTLKSDATSNPSSANSR